MLRQISPRLGRVDVMLNSFGSCISNAAKEFSWTPEMPVGKVIPQPRMLLHQFESTVPFKQIQCFADRHCWRQFNKQVDMVNSDVKLVNFTSMLDCNLSNKSFAINFQPIKLEWVHSIFNFPYEMECILPEGMFKTFQIHFFAPNLAENLTAHAKFVYLVHGDRNNPLDINKSQELNLVEEGNSSLGLKAEVSLPLM